jgi:hypothetical protein
VLEAADVVATFIIGRDRAALDTDQMLLFALVRAIEIIGEAASRVSIETQSAAPAVPWSKITAMRNRAGDVRYSADIRDSFLLGNGRSGDTLKPKPGNVCRHVLIQDLHFGTL